MERPATPWTGWVRGRRGPGSVSPCGARRWTEEGPAKGASGAVAGARLLRRRSVQLRPQGMCRGPRGGSGQQGGVAVKDTSPTGPSSRASGGCARGPHDTAEAAAQRYFPPPQGVRGEGAQPSPHIPHSVLSTASGGSAITPHPAQCACCGVGPAALCRAPWEVREGRPGKEQRQPLPSGASAPGRSSDQSSDVITAWQRRGQGGGIEHGGSQRAGPLKPDTKSRELLPGSLEGHEQADVGTSPAGSRVSVGEGPGREQPGVWAPPGGRCRPAEDS